MHCIFSVCECHVQNFTVFRSRSLAHFSPLQYTFTNGIYTQYTNSTFNWNTLARKEKKKDFCAVAAQRYRDWCHYLCFRTRTSWNDLLIKINYLTVCGCCWRQRTNDDDKWIKWLFDIVKSEKKCSMNFNKSNRNAVQWWSTVWQSDKPLLLYKILQTF